VGERGPPPKRADQRRRHTKQEDQPDTPPGAANVEIPDPDPEWHAVAKLWYRSLADSGQSIYYEPSDWAMAFLLAESMSRDLEPQAIGIAERTGEAVFERVPLKGASLSAYLKGMTALLVSEADRRRASIELQRTPPADPENEEAATIARLDDFRDRAAG
jgi:hypothetical protein